MRHPSPVIAHHTMYNEPISTYSPHFHPLLLELIPLHLSFFLVGGMIKKTLCLVLTPINLNFVSCRHLRQYFPKTAGPSCTGNMLVLAEEEREWLCLCALEGTYCLQPQLSKSVNLCLPPGHAKQQSPVQMFSEEFAEKLWRSKRKTHNEFAVEDEEAYLLNVYLTSRIHKMSKLEAREDLRLTSIDNK